MTAFKIRGVKAEDSPTVQEINTDETVEETPQVERKKRGPYRKKGEREEEARIAALAQMAPIDRLVKALEQIKGAPTKIQLQEWKDLHGKFYMSSTDGDNIFIWKTIKRTEYKSMIGSGVMDKPQMLEEFVVRRALLWPRATQEWLAGSDAGVISTLFKQIYDKSGFISDEMALTLIEKI